MSTNINNSNNNNNNNNNKGISVAVVKQGEDEEFNNTMMTTTTTTATESRDLGEVLKRRCSRLKKLSKIYKDFYWCLIEELKLKHRDYLWQFGTTPASTATTDFIEEDHGGEVVVDYKNHNSTPPTQLGRNGNSRSNGNGNSNNRSGDCEVHSCKKKAMALTRFCHSHILSDANQLLYKGCKYPTKSSPSGPTLCMKPILKSAVPSLCSNHLEKAEKHLSRCLRKEGFTGFGSNRHPLKLNVVIAEFVRHIQANRRESL